MKVQHAASIFSIEVDGTPLPAEVAGSLVEASVEDELNLPDAFELVFRDPLHSVLEAGGFGIGKKLRISVVSAESPEGKPLLNGEITAVEADVERTRTTTIVRGYDASHRLQRGTSSETHLDVTYGDIAAKVARRRGLETGDTGTSNVVHDAVVQWNQTDWEFLRALAVEVGHEVVVADGRLHFREPVDAASGPGPGDVTSEDPRQLVVGVNVLRLRATISGAEQVDEVRVRGWDFKTKEAVEGSARQGSGALSAVAGEGPERLASDLGGGVLVIADRPVGSDELAQAAADSLAQQLGSAAAELDGVAFGAPELRAGETISLAGAGDPFDGKYTLTSCRHSFDPENGYVTAFRVSGRQTRTILGLVHGRTAGESSRTWGVVPAVVTNVDDPDGVGRVKVAFPWLDERAESFWARVAVAGAGPERGAPFLPEVEDEVLVAFEHGDPRAPYVLGGLYNGKDKLPVQAVKSGQVVMRALVSRNKHKILLRDDDDAIVVETGDGKHRLVLDQKNGRIEAETTGDVRVTSNAELKIEASSGVKLESRGAIELKGNGITLDAGGGAFDAKGSTAKVTGSGTAELSSSGQTTLRGSMVMIN